MKDKIEKTKKSLEERGMKSDSFFSLKTDKDVIHKEHDTNWSDISKRKVVEFAGKKRYVDVCVLPVKSLEVTFGKLKTEIVLKKGEEAFQTNVSSSYFLPDGTVKTTHVGKKCGIIKDGKIIEERFLNGRSGVVEGFRF